MPFSLDQLNALNDGLEKHNKSLLTYKTGEYSSNENRIENFETVAALLNMRPSQIAMIYLMKHVQAIGKAVTSGKINWSFSDGNTEGLKQRILDARNYLLLLAACIESEVGDGVDHN